MKIYTHGGMFHADEVMATAILGEWERWDKRKEQPGLDVIRLKNLSEIPDDGYILDIGREYNPVERKFDHHQEFLTRPDGYPYATAGLIWEHFGKGFLDISEEVWEMVDESLIKGIDAHDSDSEYDFSASCSAGDVRVMTLSNIISSMNGDPEYQEENFKAAVKLAANVLIDTIEKCFLRSYAKSVVRKSTLSKEGRCSYYIFSESFPWHEAVCETEAEFIIAPSLLPGNPISLLAVPASPGTRELKRPIERPDWFDGFIQNGKSIAGCKDIAEAIRLIGEQ